jgi:hypothetical protein
MEAEEAEESRGSKRTPEKESGLSSTTGAICIWQGMWHYLSGNRGGEFPKTYGMIR